MSLRTLQHPKRNATVWCSREGRVVVFCPEGSRFFQMNPLASKIWESCDGKTPISRLVEILAKETQRPTQAKKDVGDFLGRLEELGLIRFVS